MVESHLAGVRGRGLGHSPPSYRCHTYPLLLQTRQQPARGSYRIYLYSTSTISTHSTYTITSISIQYVPYVPYIRYLPMYRIYTVTIA